MLTVSGAYRTELHMLGQTSDRQISGKASMHSEHISVMSIKTLYGS